MKKIDVHGKQVRELEQLTRNLRRRDLLALLARVVSLGTFFTAAEIAAARKIPKRAVIAAMKRGELRGHKPTPNRWTASLDAVREWDNQTAVSN